MDEKGDSKKANVSHDEKHATEAVQLSEPEMADPHGRHRSVALNIIENPLKVRFSFSGSAPSPSPESMLILFSPTEQHLGADRQRCSGFCREI